MKQFVDDFPSQFSHNVIKPNITFSCSLKITPSTADSVIPSSQSRINRTLQGINVILMDAGPTLFTAIGITLVIIVVVQLGLYNMRKRHKEAYPKLWDAFKKAVKEKNQLEIIRIGNELIYNTHLLQEHLSIIHKTAIELEKKDAQFESLRLNAYNKQLHYNRPLPGAFSSGGVEQTWFRRN